MTPSLKSTAKSTMSNDIFRFKQFSIRHDRCAMKVGTDGVLLGAWGNVEGHRILDIGTGTGLIALMAAQRNPEANVLGIDIDKAAVEQAQENIAESPFSKRVSCILQDVLTFQPDVPFDAILCNPPFFTEDTLPADAARALARNNQSLPFEDLIPKVASLLADEGMFSIIVPSQLTQEIIGLCLIECLQLKRQCIVHTTVRKPSRRTLMTFSTKQSRNFNQNAVPEILCLMNHDGSRSQAYQALTSSFYL